MTATAIRIAERLPEPIPQALRWCYGYVRPSWRFGRRYRETLALLERSQSWPPERVAAFQLTTLQKLLRHCEESVPYYRDLFRKIAFNSRDLHSIADLAALPCLTKELIRAHLQEMRSELVPQSDFIEATTGGSSGVPLCFYIQRGYSRNREHAFVATMWKRVGFRYGIDWKLLLTGAIPGNSRHVEYNPSKRELVCSAYYSDPRDLAHYLDLLRKQKIEYIQGHVSSIVMLAQYMHSTGQQHRLRGVLGGSEKVYPFQRKLIEEAFCTRLFSWYGHTEKAALAAECEHSNEYHIFPEYGLTELVDEEGRVITEPDRTGEIVATSFNNFAMPFVRYRTGDMARYSAGWCACGRPYRRFESLEGRSYDYVLTRQRTRVSLTGLIMGQHFRAFRHIVKMQLFQQEAGRVEIRIIRGDGYDPGRDEAEILETIARATGGGIEVSFRYVDHLALTERGKHRFLISNLQEALDP